MSRRRRSTHRTPDQAPQRRPGAAARQLLQQHSVCLEPLESRRLLTTIITDTDPLTPTPSREQFEYKDLKGNSVRVVVVGDVSAEFIFARVTKGSEKDPGGWNDVILGEHVSVFSKEDGRDLFHIYVAQASIDSYISIAQVPDPEQSGPRPMQPFEESVTLTINPLRTSNLSRSTAEGTGAIVLGTRTHAIPNVDDSGDRPIRSDNFNGQGIAPQSIANRNGRLVAGISTAENVHLGRFQFGGAIMGQVTMRGSMDYFYCGQLLTGVTEGQFTELQPESPGNFFVAGDIRNILVKGSIGGTGVESTLEGRNAPDYLTGTDFDIRGRVGQIRTGEDFQAFGTVHNTNPGLGLRTRQQEYEFRRPEDQGGSFTEFENGQLGDNEPFFNNDTFETAQFLGSINSRQLGNNSIQLNGLIQAFTNVGDIADYYAVPLMAGQEISVRLLAPLVTPTLVNINGRLVLVNEETKLPLNVGVFDPDGRLIATDYSSKTEGTSQELDNDNPAQQEQFTFIAEKPGIYRFAVAQEGDAPEFGASGDRLGALPYQLQITGVGNLGLGGLVATETISTGTAFTFGSGGFVMPRANMEVVLGDFGAIYSIEDAIDSFGGVGVNAIARGGDLRAVDAMSLGSLEGTPNQGGGFTKSGGANIMVLTGSVGMIRSRGETNAITTINRNAPFVGFPNIGGDIQYIVSNNVLVTDLAANGKIGVVHARQFGDVFDAGSLSANADGTGSPGTIDLIDVTESLGTAGTGGPIISAGPGGNVRYVHVTPGIPVFRPTIFGGGSPEDTTFVAGQVFNYTDDSGANVRITPTIDRVFNPTTGGVTDNSGTLTVLSYPIAQSVTSPLGTGAGLAILRVTSTRGLRIDTDGATEIGDIESTGSGPGLVVDPFRPNGADNIAGNGDETYVLNPNATGNAAENSITLAGAGRRGVIDVWNIRGNNFNFIRNHTGGEMVNAQIGQTGTVLATNIGWARSNVRPGMLVEGSTVADLAGTSGVDGDVFPYLQTRNAFTINGGEETSPALLNLHATQAIGNVMITGITQNIIANVDGAGIRGTFEGIIGAIFTLGQIRMINVGEGLLPSGSGNFARAGLYAVCTDPGANVGCGRIWHVVAENADIRGDIASNTAIDRITVVNGSIINADLMVMQSAADAGGTGAALTPTLEWGGGGVITSGANRSGEIGAVNVVGGGTVGGGIIGNRIVAFNIGPVTVNGGFGIFNSVWQTTGTGRIQQISADGYGLRGVTLSGGQSVGGMSAIGDGQRLQTTKFSRGVRLSETLAVDPFFGTKPNGLTDLHVVLGTTRANPARKGVSASGSIDWTTVGVSRDIGPVKANTVRASEFNIPNLFTSFETSDYVDTVTFLAGRIPLLAIGKDALRFQAEIAGDAPLVSIGGAFRGSSNLTVRGKLGRVVTGTTLYGNVYGQLGIDSIRVGTHYGSQGTRTPGSLGEFITNGHVLTDSVLTVEKELTRLVIGGDVQDGALVRVGTLGTKTIIGEEAGTIDTKPWA